MYFNLAKTSPEYTQAGVYEKYMLLQNQIIFNGLNYIRRVRRWAVWGVQTPTFGSNFFLSLACQRGRSCTSISLSHVWEIDSTFFEEEEKKCRSPPMQ